MSADPTKKSKAIVLLSGGLDSMLAVKVLQEQDVEVVGLSFKSPFFDARGAERAARELGIPLLVVDMTEELLEVLKEPKHGFGRFFNPCTDCHALMVKKAYQLLREVGADFVATGEVLGQRPKSQQKHALNAVAKDSGARGLLLRPLSAKLLPPTEPEERGLVDRNRLLDLQGRGRQRQMELAAKYGLEKYPSPAGGCLLTDVAIARRLRRIFQHYKDVLDPSFLHISKIGRHFWVGQSLIVVARNESETNEIRKYTKQTDYLLELADTAGPLTVVRSLSEPSPELLHLAALLTVRYSKARTEERVWVQIVKNDASVEQRILVTPSQLNELLQKLSVEQL
ncbi:tRNA 4-thiouridine(8) synthase ThiI [Coprothermobacteraceae bacterium]|nr:tRNA 4-thiouridine(8) synthase ThiI [Coprothermobacteraceae bacterium]